MKLSISKVKAAVLAGLICIGMLAQAGAVKAESTESLIVAGGCFWCVEADFEAVEGVKEAISGYTGGTTKNPTYKQVTKGGTGHYEAVKILYDPAQVSRKDLLAKFFRSVDPTDAGGQFCDRGESYRTAVFVEGEAERDIARNAKAKAQAELGQEIVTPILAEAPFYDAEDYHQDYYKGEKLILTRFGPKTQASAYKAYRKSCGRDARVNTLWGSEAPFTAKYLN